MPMQILHNSLDNVSRDFVAEVQALPIIGLDIFDWYDGGLERWVDEGGDVRASAFPTVVILIPAHRVNEGDEGTVTHPARQRRVRKVVSIADLNNRMDLIDVVLANSTSLGLPAVAMERPWNA